MFRGVYGSAVLTVVIASLASTSLSFNLQCKYRLAFVEHTNNSLQILLVVMKQHPSSGKQLLLFV